MTRRTLQFDGETINPLRVSAPDLIAWIDRRAPHAIGNWNDLGRDEYARAFTAAKTAGLNVIDDLYFAFYDTIQSGGTETDFAKAVIPTLKAKGWLGDADDATIATRVNLIYDTNLRVARASGFWDRVQRTKTSLPYLRGTTAQDERVRHPPKSQHSDHRAWQGIILPADHPFWTRWWYPLGFRCRCAVVQMTRSQVMRWPGGITSDDDLAEREARLGTPIFLPPGAGAVQQIAAAARFENDRPDRMPGLPMIDPAAERATAVAAWSNVAAAALIDNLIDALFG